MPLSNEIKSVICQAGVTILEFMAFIGLAALTIGGATALYSSARASAVTSELVNTANHVANTVRATFPGGSGADTALNSDNVVATMNGVAKITGWGDWSKWNNRAIIKKGDGQIHVYGTGGKFSIVIHPNDQRICESLKTQNPTVGDTRAREFRCENAGWNWGYWSGIPF